MLAGFTEYFVTESVVHDPYLILEYMHFNLLFLNLLTCSCPKEIIKINKFMFYPLYNITRIIVSYLCGRLSKISGIGNADETTQQDGAIKRFVVDSTIGGIPGASRATAGREQQVYPTRIYPIYYQLSFDEGAWRGTASVSAFAAATAQIIYTRKFGVNC